MWFLEIVIAIESILLAIGGLKLMRVKYDGTVDVIEDDGKKTFSLEVDSDLDTLDQKTRLIFRVHKANS